VYKNAGVDWPVSRCIRTASVGQSEVLKRGILEGLRIKLERV